MKCLHQLVSVSMDMWRDSFKYSRLTAAMISCICFGLSVCVRAEGKGISRSFVDVRGQEELIGTWKACRLSSCLLRPSSDITWKEICFATNGIVSIVLKEGEGDAVRRMAGAYALHNKAEAGYAPKREIRIDLKNIKGASTVVLHNIRIGEFSCFPRGKYVLWFRDESGKDCVYEPFAVEMVNTNRYIEVKDSLSACPVRLSVSKHERKGVSLSQKLCEGLIRAEADIYEQHKAILRIMNEGDSSCVSTLVSFTMPDKDSLLRQDAIRALGAVGSPAAVTHLVQMLKAPVVSRQYDEDEEAAILRRAIVCALKQIGDVSALPTLESVASSTAEYKSVREMAQSAVELLSNGSASR